MTPESAGDTLAHVTADTGHARQSSRSEVPPRVLEALAPMVAARGGYVPGFDGWTWAGWTDGRALCWTVRTPDGFEAVRCAASPGGDRAAWQSTADAASLSGGIDPASDPPDGPWLLAAIRPGWPGGHPDAGGWLVDFSRCMAWAWIGGRRMSVRHPPPGWGGRVT